MVSCLKTGKRPRVRGLGRARTNAENADGREELVVEPEGEPDEAGELKRVLFGAVFIASGVSRFPLGPATNGVLRIRLVAG